MFKKLKEIGKRFSQEIKVYQLVRKDNRTPFLAKLLLGLALGYFFLPFDIIPDFIPVFGQLDDMLIIPVLVIIAVKFIPKEVIEDCRRKLLTFDD